MAGSRSYALNISNGFLSIFESNIYKEFKIGQTIYNKITSTSTFGIMNKTDATRYNQYWNDVKQSLITEQRYNYQLYGDMNGSNNFEINIPKDRSISRYY